MSFIKAKKHLEKYGFADKIIEFEESTDTVELAAKALGVSTDEIAKSLCFDLKDSFIIIVLSGDSRINNKSFKDVFKKKAKMLVFDKVEEIIGHEPGGVCPFGINDNILVYLDKSLQKHNIIYPACGSANSAVKLSIPELELCSSFVDWIDISVK